MFSHWTLNREKIMQFIDQAQKQHPRIKFTAEISDRETNDGSDWKTFSVLLKPSQRQKNMQLVGGRSFPLKEN